MFYNFTNQYDEYELDIYDLQGSTAGVLNLFVSTDGSTFLGDAGYSFGSMYAPSNVTTVSSNSANAVSGLFIGYPASAAGQLGAAYIKFAMPWTTDRYKYFMSDAWVHSAGAVVRYAVAGGYFGATGLQPLKGIGVSPSSGNITRAVVNLYGIVKAGAGGS
jgi:hypothetical protein